MLTLRHFNEFRMEMEKNCQTSMTILCFVHELGNKQKITKRFVYDVDDAQKSCNLRPRSLKTILNAAKNEQTEAKAQMFLLKPFNGLTQIKSCLMFAQRAGHTEGTTSPSNVFCH